MAHYVAELMVRAERAALPERDEAQQLCARAILDLWAQACIFPAKRGPFDSIDQVIEVINSLHPDGGPHYRNELWRALDARATHGDTEIEELLKAAVSIDGAARNLIHHLLSHAAHAAGRNSAEWLELAKNLDEEDPLNELRIRIVTAGQEEAQLKNQRIEQLERRIAQLGYFSSATNALKENLEKSLASAKCAGST